MHFGWLVALSYLGGEAAQTALGISDKVHALRERLSEEEYNQYSVRLELQADYFAGVWAHHAQALRNILEPGDLKEAIDAATAMRTLRTSAGVIGHVRRFLAPRPADDEEFEEDEEE